MTRTLGRTPTALHNRGRLSAKERKTLQRAATQRYTDGASIREIAVEISRSYGFVYRLLEEAEVSRRPRGTRPTSATSTPPLPCGTAIRDVTHEDRGAVITLVADAFAASATGRWLDPNPTTRRRYARRRATAAVDGALAHGTVRVVDSDHTPVAVALWVRYPIVGQPTDPSPRYIDAEITDPHVRQRAEELDRLLQQRRPGAAHEYLTGLGVHPSWHNDGLRTYLLTDRHHTLAALNLPTFLDVDGPELRRWCRKHGYLDQHIGDPIRLPGARTQIWPMWRPAAAVDNCSL